MDISLSQAPGKVPRGRLIRSSLLLGAMLACGVASAQVSGTMDVTLQLVEGCIVNGSSDPLNATDFGTMDFGVAPTLFSNDLHAQAMLGGSPTRLTCTNGATLNIRVGAGQNASGGARHMASGANFVEYELRTEPNGGGQAYTIDADVDLSHLATGVAFDLPIYGVVHPQPGVTAGSYQDTVSITLTF